MGKFKRVCVFCGSNSGNRKIFSDAALDLGRELVERKMDLVYGGGSIGLMGLVSQTVYDGGCHVLGVIPTALVPLEISGHAVGQVLIVPDMHERKAEMARRADAFIALPGGYGTMEELLEMIAWSQLGIHDKPVGLLNVDGYYDCLLGLFDKGVDEGFIKPSDRNIVVASNTAHDLIQKMEVGLLNLDGYYDCLLGLFDKGVDEGFIKPSDRNIVVASNMAHDLIQKMEDYMPLHDQVAPSQSWNI